MAKLTLRKVHYHWHDTTGARYRVAPEIRWVVERGGCLCVLPENAGCVLAMLWPGEPIHLEDLIMGLWGHTVEGPPLYSDNIIRVHVSRLDDLGESFGFRVRLISMGIYQLTKTGDEDANGD